MSVSTAGATGSRSEGGFWSTIGSRQLSAYPNRSPRYAYLALVVIITTVLYYELYVGGSVATLQLSTLHMSFSFYVLLLAFGNLIGAFGSLMAGLTDRLGRCNLVVVGLFITAILVGFVLPEASSKWAFGIEGFAVGLVEGICLVATPALIRDFSPQVGRGSAMGFWTMGPVLGSLVVSVVGSNTINAHTTWPHEYRICGVAGVVVFALAFLFLRELSPGLRDQLMVSLRDRALVEAKAKGLDIEASLKHPFRQLIRPEIVISALGVSLLLLSYYTAVAFGTIYFTTIFGFSLKQANGLANWNWGINILALILSGFLSDKIRVRKPFMVVGGVWAAIATVIFLSAAGHHETYYHMVLLTALVSFGLGLAYVAWMASFTESVEARNPALTATGLAIWGWIIRVTIFVSFLVLPLVINTVNPLVDYGTGVSTIATKYAAPLAYAQKNPATVAFATKNAAILGFATQHAALVTQATKDQAQLAALQKYAPEVKAIAANPALFTKLASYPSASQVPPALLAQAVTALGGPAKATPILTSIDTNKAAILGALGFAKANPTLVAQATTYGSQLKALGALAATQGPALAKVQAGATELAALAAIPKADLAYITLHGAAVAKAAKDSPGQWKDWYWIAFGGVIVFLMCIPLLKGRWSPSKAREDEEAHEALVQAEMAKLNA